MNTEFIISESLPCNKTNNLNDKLNNKLNEYCLGTYHNFESCENTRGIDNLLSRYKKDREIILYFMLYNPDKLISTIWKREGLLGIDNECRCKMGLGENRSPYSCAQCKNMRRLIDFKLGAINRPFKIECGEMVGKKFIISSTDISSLFLQWDTDSTKRAKLFVRQYNMLNMCGTPNISEMKNIVGDTFTIRTLLTWMIHKIFMTKGLPHCHLLNTIFVCCNKGYSLYEMPSIGNISDLHKIEDYHELDTSIISMKLEHFIDVPLKTEIVQTIIKQLLVILIELSAINFSHGSPSINSLIFIKEPVSYIYDGIHIEGPITLQITDLWNSSATFNNIHYSSKNLNSSMYLEKDIFVPEIATRETSMAYCQKYKLAENIPNVCQSNNILLYRLTNSTINIYNAMRHIGFPIYIGSFDFYCLIISLMCDKSFYNAVINNDNLYKLWCMMWISDDLENIENKIKHYQTTNIDITPVDIIRGVWLRCDIVNYIWSLVKIGWLNIQNN